MIRLAARSIALSAAAILFLAPVFAWAQTENGEEIRELEAAQEQERKILARLDEIEKKAARIEDRLIEIEDGITGVKKDMDRGDKEIRRIGLRVADQKKRLARRLTAVYRLRDGGFLQALLRAESIPELTRRYRYLMRILRRDEEMLKEYGRQTSDLASTQSRLDENQNRLYGFKAELDEEREKLNEARRENTLLLMKVHRRKQLYLALLKSREESRRRLIKEVIIRPEEKKAEEARKKPAAEPVAERKWPDFQGQKGRIPRPVSGRITGGFGRRPGPFNTTITRHGQVFSAPAGAPVGAVMDGEVLYVGWMRGYGNIIVLNHGKRYYTLTGGLAGIRIKTGEWVRQGDTLGLVPKGSQKMKKDIYFEIRHRSQALDPAGWLGKKPVTKS